MTVHQDWDQVEARDISTLGAPSWAWGKPSGVTARATGKRAFDLVLAVILLIPLSVVIAAVALLLLVVQGRPILYVAPRMRSPHNSFMHLKFRTMMDQENDSGVTGAHKKWRITPLGHILRKTSLDELLQLWSFLLPPADDILLGLWRAEAGFYFHESQPPLSHPAQVSGQSFALPT